MDLERLGREVAVILHKTAAWKAMEFRIEVVPEVRHLVLDPARLRLEVQDGGDGMALAGAGQATLPLATP